MKLKPVCPELNSNREMVFSCEVDDISLLGLECIDSLGGRKGIQPVKTEWWGAGVVICLEHL